MYHFTIVKYAPSPRDVIGQCVTASINYLTVGVPFMNPRILRIIMISDIGSDEQLTNCITMCSKG